MFLINLPIILYYDWNLFCDWYKKYRNEIKNTFKGIPNAHLLSIHIDSCGLAHITDKTYARLNEGYKEMSISRIVWNIPQWIRIQIEEQQVDNQAVKISDETAKNFGMSE